MTDSGREDERAPSVPLEALLDAVPEMVALLRGPDHLIRFANRRFRELAGGRPLVDSPLGKALPGLRCLLPLLARARETGERQEARGQVVRLHAPGTSDKGLPIVRRVQGVAGAAGWQGARRAHAEACNRRATQPAGMQRGRIGPVSRLEAPKVERLLDVVIEPLADRGAAGELALSAREVMDGSRAAQPHTSAGGHDTNTEARRALRHSEDRFRALVTAVSEVVYRMSPDWTEMLQLNSQGFLAGMKQPSSRWPDEYIPPEELPAVNAAVQKAIRTKSVFVLEHRVRQADGSVGWTASRAVPILDANGVITEWFGVANDITKRKRAEEALRESEARFREMVDSLPLIVWVHDAEGQQELVNETFCEFFGVSREVMKGGRWQMLMHPDDADAYVEEFQRCTRARRPFHAEVRVKRADGQWRLIESWARPRFTPQGEFRGFVGTSADVTERNQAEEALRASEARLRESDQRKDEFLAMLGHELRNPLAAICNATELIELEKGEAPSLEQVHGVLDRQSTHMARLIDGLLEVSRISRGKIQLEQDFLDVREVLDEVTRARASEVQARGLELNKDIPPEPVWTFGDPTRLAQIFENLVGNALKFTSSPGTVTVSVQVDDGTALVRVRDTGAGIRPELLSDVFKPFHQQAQEPDRAAGGLGLGLAVAKGLVELHKGSIEAHSEGLGRGTELVVRLPLASAPTAVQETELRIEAPSQRVLLVEDSADAAMMLRALLETRGHAVTMASTGPEALQLLRRHGADVVLCDVGLPGMSGYEVARAIREDDGLRGTALVAVTGYGQPEDRRQARAAGFDDHLTKPVDLHALQTVLSGLSRPQR